MQTEERRKDPKQQVKKKEMTTRDRGAVLQPTEF